MIFSLINICKKNETFKFFEIHACFLALSSDSQKTFFALKIDTYYYVLSKTLQIKHKKYSNLITDFTFRKWFDQVEGS